MSWSTAFDPSRGGPQLDNGEVFSALKIRHFQSKRLARCERSYCPASHSLIGPFQLLVHLRRRPSPKRLVWPVSIVQVPNAIPTRPKHSKCSIRGIHSTVRRFLCTASRTVPIVGICSAASSPPTLSAMAWRCPPGCLTASSAHECAHDSDRKFRGRVWSLLIRCFDVGAATTRIR